MIRAVGAAILVAATLAAGAAARSADTIIAVVSTATSLTPHDVAPKGKPNAGDYVVMDDRLTNALRQFGKAKGAVVGSDHAVERIGTGGTVTIEGVARLPDGTVRFKGPLRRDAKGRTIVSVSGGTGKYANAGGTVTIVNLQASGAVALNVYKLTLLPVS